MMYVQCEMRKGNQIDVSWIEEKFAIVGKVIKRKTDQETEWNEGWVVTATYSRMSEEHVKKARDLYKHHRKGTDI